MAIPSPTFHRFSDLPPELRLEIWGLTLLEINKPYLSLFRYNKKLWHTWCRRRTEPGWDTEQDSDFVSQDLRVTSPLPAAAQVNHEARAAILYRNRNNEGSSKMVVERTFDRSQDLMYFRGAHASYFSFFPVLFRNDVPSRAIGVCQVAIDEDMFIQNLQDSDTSKRGRFLLGLYHVFRVLEVLHIVRRAFGAQLDGCREYGPGRGRWTKDVDQEVFHFSSSSDERMRVLDDDTSGSLNDLEGNRELDMAIGK